jgi:hypothetical protein
MRPTLLAEVAGSNLSVGRGGVVIALPAWTSAHLLVLLLTADIVDADSFFAKVNAGEILPADVRAGQIHRLFEEVFFGDRVDDDDVVKGVDELTPLNAPFVGLVLLRVGLDH